jgi:hypothetical protein
MQEIILGEGQFAQNKQRICNYLNVNKVEPIFIKLDSTP